MPIRQVALATNCIVPLGLDQLLILSNPNNQKYENNLALVKRISIDKVSNNDEPVN